MNERQQEFVEAFGRYYESHAGARTAGRMLAWLMICDPPHKTAAELVDELGVSAGSVSTIARQLTTVGLMERITFPGERASYHRLREHAWVQAMDMRMNGLRELHGLAMTGRHVESSDRPDRVEELIHVTEFLIERWPRLMDELGESMTTETGAQGA
jgi:hypothetical protein